MHVRFADGRSQREVEIRVHDP
ncbi:MAG: hypothetical protein JWM05_1750, partial [Acidimicrobiales bacterium]|nr:hypothetical protein [Acidimicrobiales bacterium]